MRSVFVSAALACALTACATTAYTPPQQAPLIMSPECAEEYKLAEPMTDALAFQARLSTARSDKKQRGILKAEDTGQGINITPVSGQNLAIFPRCAAENELTGRCDVALDLGRDGGARNLEAICNHPMFEAYAIQMVSSAAFAPVTHAGRSVDYPGIIYPVEYTYTE